MIKKRKREIHFTLIRSDAISGSLKPDPNNFFSTSNKNDIYKHIKSVYRAHNDAFNNVITYVIYLESVHIVYLF